jgi:UDP-4-amino-4,6-dideoxy-N-acetyl-beta-L-altrosamine N-acetyltransferase
MVYSDLERVLIWRNHPDVRRNMFTQHKITQTEHLEWFERNQTDQNKHLLIFETNHLPLGFVSFEQMGEGGVAVWGFYVAPDAPRGSGQSLGRAALDHAFSQCRFHKVCGQVLSINQRSIKFHHSLGFQQEGILRDQHFDGERYHNSIFLGLLSHEWQKIP